jgi:hypothetical protein
MSTKTIELRFDVAGDVAATKMQRLGDTASQAAKQVGQLQSQLQASFTLNTPGPLANPPRMGLPTGGLGSPAHSPYVLQSPVNSPPPSSLSSPPPFPTGSPPRSFPTSYPSPAPSPVSNPPPSPVNSPPPSPTGTSGGGVGGGAGRGSGGGTGSGGVGGNPWGPFLNGLQSASRLLLTFNRSVMEANTRMMSSFHGGGAASGGAGGPGGGPANPTPGGFFTADVRSQLIMETLMHKGFNKTGLTMGSLGMFNDHDLMNFRQSLDKKPSPPSQSDASGFLSLAMPTFGKIGASAARIVGGAAAAGAVPMAMVGASHQLNLLAHQGGATDGEIARNLMNSNLITRQVMGGIDMLTGRESAIAKVDHDFGFQRVRNEGAMNERAFGRQIGMERSFLENRSTVLGGDTRIVGMPNVNRSTVLGDRAYEEAMLRRPVEQAGLQREREHEIAKRNLQTEEAALAKTQREINEQQKIANFKMNVAQGFGGAQGLEAANLAQLATENVQKLQAEKRQRLERADAARGRVVETEAGVKRTAVDLLRVDAEVLSRREAFGTNLAQSVGALTPMERQQALGAHERVMQLGEYAAPDDIAMAARIDPEGIAKMREASGKQFLKENKGVLKNAPDLDDIRKKLSEPGDPAKGKEGGILVKIEQLERQQAADVAKEFHRQIMAEPFMNAMRALIQADVKAGVDALEQQVLQRLKVR